MKKLIITSLAAAFIGLGCQHPSAGKFLAQTEITVDSTMKGWATYVVSSNGKVTPEQEAAVRNQYGTVQKTMLVASNAWKTSLVSKDNTSWVVASNAVYNARLGFVTIVQQNLTK